MPALDFPSSPVDGQIFGNYTYDSGVAVWRATPQVASGLPAGTIVQWPGAVAPTSWLICDGSAVSRSTYASLFAAIGTQYGSGDGSTTFNVPNLKGRVAVGLDSSQTEFNTLGETGGAKTHTLTTSEMPSHTHTGTTSTNGSHSHGGINYSTSHDGSTNGNVRRDFGANYNLVDFSAGSHNHTFTTDASGSGGAHNNLQPYIVLNYIIKTSAGVTAGDSELATRVGSTEAINTSQNTRLTTLETFSSNAESAWTAYTPTLYNATVGNGTIAFYYKKIGKTVFIRGRFSLGSTSNIGTLLDWSLPFGPASSYGGLPSLGQAAYYNGAIFYGTNVFIGGGIVMRSIRYIRNASDTIQNGEITPTQPFTWGNGCFWEVEFNYEVA